MAQGCLVKKPSVHQYSSKGDVITTMCQRTISGLVLVIKCSCCRNWGVGRAPPWLWTENDSSQIQNSLKIPILVPRGSVCPCYPIYSIYSSRIGLANWSTAACHERSQGLNLAASHVSCCAYKSDVTGDVFLGTSCKPLQRILFLLCVNE